MKVLIRKHDLILYFIYLPTEAKQIFGRGWSKDAVEIPSELALDIDKTYKKLCKLSEALGEIKRSREAEKQYLDGIVKTKKKVTRKK